MTIRVLDTETTGTDPSSDKVCEIAAVDIVKAGSKYTAINPISHFVNPGIPMPAQASAVHHIIDSDLVGAPNLEDVMDRYASNNGDLIIVAHNASFEKSFLEKAFSETETEVKWLCTYKAALRVWPDLPSHSNQFLRYHMGFVDPFGVKRDGIVAHRALGDCYVTGCIFIALLQRAKFADMLAWTSEPALFTTFRFGKHKGQRYDAVPDDYLEWIVNKSDMDADTKFSASYWLARKKTSNAA